MLCSRSLSIAQILANRHGEAQKATSRRQTAQTPQCLSWFGAHISPDRLISPPVCACCNCCLFFGLAPPHLGKWGFGRPALRSPIVNFKLARSTQRLCIAEVNYLTYCSASHGLHIQPEVSQRWEFLTETVKSIRSTTHRTI